MSHLANLEQVFGSFIGKRILDVGAGDGEFMVECAKAGCDAVGIELKSRKLDELAERGRKSKVTLNVVQGDAQGMPFKDNEFDFVNLSEVLEHVKDPAKLMREVCRVLKSNGRAYVSVHNRFGVFDNHYHVYFLNWMPRRLGEIYLQILGKQKKIFDEDDCQRISDMHYYTFGGFRRFASAHGFSIGDTRETKLKERFHGIQGWALLFVYRFAVRPLYFSTFHIALNKTTQ